MGTAMLASACVSWPDLPAVDLLRRCNGNDLELCDIRDAGCRLNVTTFTACLRDEPVSTVPPTRLLSLNDFAAELSGSVDPVEAERLNAAGRALALIDLADRTPLVDTSIANNLSFVAAFYSTDDKTVSIIDRGQPLDDLNAIGVLAHELTHALQDRDISIDALYAQYGTDDDRGLAIDAIVEGEAELYQVMMRLTLQRQSYWGFDWQREYEAQQARAFDEVVQSTAPIVMTPGTFPYSYGSHLVSDAWLSGQAGAVRELFAAPPQSSAEVLAGYGASYETLEPITTTPTLPTSLADFALIEDTALGAWYLDVLPPRFFSTAGPFGDGWRGDRIWLYRRTQPESAALIWVVRWSANQNQAPEFVDFLTQVGDLWPWRFAVNGRMATWVASDDATTLDDWLSAAEPLLVP